MKYWRPQFLSLGLALLSSAIFAGEKAAAPLPVHMLVPGFTVNEIPIALTNINTLEYLPDGRLIALGYDGRVHILTDTDGDGLEDTAKVFWNNPNNALRGPVGLAWRPEGVYVAAKGKVSLLKDTNGDGEAETEEVVASGWKEGWHNVDALGVAFDKDNNFYFGIGCANFADAYLEGKEAVVKYDIKSDYGTIQKVSADRKKREIICTGIRFPVNLAINRHGDVFCTDQEGDTWTHGNHLDEINHIIPGRHYGFPERHPQKLPNTIDDPPILGFGPQHQSTCGLKFNEKARVGKTFGPAFWENDAIVIGESRGKIWRAQLVKTPAGYVGRHVLIACTGMLTIDSAVSPKGALAICCHSGPPDWGTGPKGNGRLFKIFYTDEAAPQPVVTWAESTRTLRVAFDRPINPSILDRLDGLTLTGGEFVRAGDRYETMRPPYKVVNAQTQTPTKTLKVLDSALSSDGRTLTLMTESMPWIGHYALALPGVLAVGQTGIGATVDVDFELTGVWATWTPDGTATPAWRGWLPHFDPEVTREILSKSAEHEKFLGLIEKPGQLTFDAFIELNATGALPATVENKALELSIESNAPFVVGVASRLKAAPVTQTDSRPVGELHHAKISARRELKVGIPIAISARTGANGKSLALRTSFHTDANPFNRQLTLTDLIGTFAPGERQEMASADVHSPLTKGGDWEKGKSVFAGEGKCITCHMVRNEGAAIGPNLSNLVHVNAESVFNDIVDPNRAINPDFVSYLVKLADGRAITGLVVPEGKENYRIVENADKSTVVARTDVKELKISKTSLMPEGMREVLGPEKLRDLLTFLTTEQPKKK